MQTTKIQFIPGAVDVMREHTAAQYEKLLLNYDTFQINDEVVDGIVEHCVPHDILCAVSDDAGKATWGLHPIIASNRVTEDILMEMIERLDAMVDWADDGRELDIWCSYDESIKMIRNDNDDKE
jgi:hypothetical protein